MRATTLLRTMGECQARQEVICHRRRKGSFGVAVDDDPLAKRWQHIERLRKKCYTRIYAILVNHNSYEL